MSIASVARPEDAPDEFDAAYQRALEARETQGVIEYTWKFWKDRGQAIQGLLSTCVDKAGPDVRGTLRIVVNVKEDGGANAILVKPDADYSRCIASGFAQFEFPRPPALFGDGVLPVLFEIKLK